MSQRPVRNRCNAPIEQPHGLAVEQTWPEAPPHKCTVHVLGVLVACMCSGLAGAVMERVRGIESV